MDKGTDRRLVPFQLADRWGFKQPDGTVVVNPIFEQVGTFIDGLCSVRRNKLWGVIDETGLLQVPHQWFRELHFQEMAAVAQDERGLHLIDRHGHVLADLGETPLILVVRVSG